MHSSNTMAAEFCHRNTGQLRPPSSMNWPTRIRFALISLLHAVVSAAVGSLLVRLAFRAWQNGSISMKGRSITPSDHPIEFVFATALAGLGGVFLICVSLLLLVKIFAPAAEQAQIAADNPKIFGQTRPVLVWVLVALVAMVGFALIHYARAGTASPGTGRQALHGMEGSCVTSELARTCPAQSRHTRSPQATEPRCSFDDLLPGFATPRAMARCTVRQGAMVLL